jgi:nitronate monooxygenase
MVTDRLAVPIVLAPLSGGPSTPELTAAVCNAGGLGFLAAAYLSAAQLAERLSATRALTDAPFGVNVFVPGRPTDPAVYEDYVRELAGDPAASQTSLGTPRFDDDDWAAKIELLVSDPVAAVSFTFGCPGADVLQALAEVGSEVWITVTTPDEAREAQFAGADVLVLQGAEAGGHRASFVDSPLQPGFTLLSLVQLVRAETELPIVASGGIATGEALAAVLVAGAAAGQLGTAFLRCPEAGTSQVHRDAVESDVATAMTRAFSGRLARGVRNRFMSDHDAHAPLAYPEIHYVTTPLRAAGRASGNADVVNLWAGQTHELAMGVPAAEVVSTIAAAARAALDSISARPVLR